MVALNRFPADSEAEIALVMEKCKELGVNTVLSDVWAKGGEGGIEMAKEVVRLCEEESNTDFAYCYDLGLPLSDKIKAISKKIYRAKHVVFEGKVMKDLQKFTDMGYGDLPVCMAKTQYSFSDDATLLCAPEDFNIHVMDVRICAGAGFVVALTGNVMTMPGLPKSPSAERIDVSDDGVISGLF